MAAPIFILRLQLRWVGSVPVNRDWVEGFFRFDEIELRPRIRTNDLSIKTTSITNVTRSLFPADIRLAQSHFENDAVLIIINQDSLNLLRHAGGLPFFPKLLPRTGPIVRQHRIDAELEGFVIHVCKHENFLALCMPGNTWN